VGTIIMMMAGWMDAEPPEQMMMWMRTRAVSRNLGLGAKYKLRFSN
jgi:hypothetical protein